MGRTGEEEDILQIAGRRRFVIEGAVTAQRVLVLGNSSPLMLQGRGCAAQNTGILGLQKGISRQET